MRIPLSIVTTAIILSALVGCKGKAREMSRYPYFVKMMDNRWEFVRNSFRSPSPDLGFCPVLLKDIEGIIMAVEASYTGANKAQLIEKLNEMDRSFQGDLAPQVDMRFNPVTLKPGATAEDVGKSIEKAYQKYLEFRKMVKLE